MNEKKMIDNGRALNHCNAMHCLVLSVTNRCEWCDSGWWRWNPEFVDIVHDWWCWWGSYLKWALRTSSGPAIMKKGKKFVLSQWSEILHLSWKKKVFISGRESYWLCFLFWWSRWPIHSRWLFETVLIHVGHLQLSSKSWSSTSWSMVGFCRIPTIIIADKNLPLP